jgi:hypothetical protein
MGGGITQKISCNSFFFFISIKQTDATSTILALVIKFPLIKSEFKKNKKNFKIKIKYK